MEASN